jgi:hypothetical protein
MSVRLGKELVCLLLDRSDSICACDEAKRWMIFTGELYERARKLCGITTLFAVHAFPRRDSLFRALRVVVDRGFGKLG